MTDRDVQDRIGEHGGGQATRRTSLLATPGPAWRSGAPSEPPTETMTRLESTPD